jgi:DNA-binding NtrC family response regulator
MRGSKPCGARYPSMDSAAKPTILVVEDEALILMDAVCFLEDAGFICLEAANAEQASLLLNGHPEIAALFTDIEMTGRRSGLDLAQEAHRMRPDMAVLIASGQICPLAAALPPKSVFIPKPYLAEAVTGALHTLLAA